MKLSRLFFLLLLPGLAAAENMVRVEDATNSCQSSGCMYYEWKLTPFDDVRFVASGYEDGIEYSFFRVTDAGVYELLLQVNPVVVDSDGLFWWGYPWVISDIARYESPCGLYLSATYEHEIVRDGYVNVPEWQKQLPAVLFFGEKGGSNIEQGKLDFKPAKLADLIERARED